MTCYLIDDHPLVRNAIAMTIQRMRSNVKVVQLERFTDLASSLARNGEPELFVLDLLLPGVKGTSAIKEVRESFKAVPIVVISSMPAGEAEEQCIGAGADAYIEKTATPTKIMQSLHAVFSADDDELVTDQAAEIKLSKRQKQLIVMLDRGLGNREIAENLDISEHTVKVHMWRLFRRIDVKSRTQALNFCRTRGLL